MRIPAWLVVCVLLVTASAVTVAVVLTARKPGPTVPSWLDDPRRCPGCGHEAHKLKFRDDRHPPFDPKSYRCPNCGRTGKSPPPAAD